MSRNLILIISALALIIIASLVGLWINNSYITKIRSNIEHYQSLSVEYRSNVRLLENEINAIAINPTRDLFSNIDDTMNKTDSILNTIQNGDSGNIEGMPEGISKHDKSLYESWINVQTNYKQLSNEAKNTILNFYSQISILRNVMPDLEFILEDAVEELTKTNSNTKIPQLMAISKQIQLLKDLRIYLHRIQEVSNRDSSANLHLNTLILITSDVREIQELTEVLLDIDNTSIHDTPPLTNTLAKKYLKKFYDDFGKYSEFLLSIPETYNAVEEMSNASKDIINDLSKSFDEAQLLATDLINTESFYKKNTILNYLLWFTVAVGSLLIGIIAFLTQKNNTTIIAKRNQQNQNAILRLLDEIGGLADGDLTTEATVTEDFTGAIADSINLAIGQLRRLVETINHTALQVTSSVQDTRNQTFELAEASRTQAQEITSASIAINNVASAIEKVSSSAAQSSMVAESSVMIANKGNQIVHDTIVGMNNIREQIQDTSKRIKRLGESSQEIGDIIGLINDIADQTNILALNAAIQASMAGDAGHGFAVVADEVQRLAERSANATKQIESLVKAIQNDTSEAVISMEQTTAEVVRGANLAQDAGISLEEIEKVSQNLAKLIQNISKEAQQQSSSAAYIASSMDLIHDITTKTTEGTQNTSKQISELMSLVEELRESVSGFELVKID